MEISEIKRRLSIRDVLLYYGIETTKKYIHCPFHQERTDKKMSMVINDSSNTVYCFSSKCAHGTKIIDVIDFVMYKESATGGQGLDKHEAILKATQLVEQGFISSISQEGAIKTHAEKDSEKRQLPQLKKLNDNKLYYQSSIAHYYILGGLPKTYDSMKVMLLIVPKGREESGRFKSRETTNLYEDKQIEKRARESSLSLELEYLLMLSDLYKLADLVEKYVEIEDRQLVKEELREQKKALTKWEQEDTLRILQSKHPITEIGKLLGKTGIVGEEKNRIFLFLVAFSHKLYEHLHALIQGSSGSGKTILLKKISDCMPAEDVTRLTRISDKALYNFGEYFFVNRLLCIEDWDGLSEEAEYVVREMIGGNEVNSAVAAKSESGNVYAKEKLVRCKMSTMACTTKGEIYEDNAGRVFIVAVDESEAQTKRIIEYQNKKAGGKINKKEEEKSKLLLQNIVRLLKPYEVINPYSEAVLLPEEAHKIRRLNGLFQILIHTVTIVNQYKRNKDKETLISDIEDVETTVEIMFDSIVLKVDELDGSLRQFYERLKSYIEKQHKDYYQKAEFTQREIRQALKLSKTQINRYLQDLIELEYIAITGGHINKGYRYKISYWDDYKALRARIKEDLLKQIEKIKKDKTQQGIEANEEKG